MSRNLSDDEFLERVALQSQPEESGLAPSRLKSKIYSALVREQGESGALLGFEQTKAAGHGLCIFEEVVRIAPVGEAAKCANICRVCHARILAEQLEHPPIYWPGCPYVSFKKT
jgi:hypothetical protein